MWRVNCGCSKFRILPSLRWTQQFSLYLTRWNLKCRDWIEIHMCIWRHNSATRCLMARDYSAYNFKVETMTNRVSSAGEPMIPHVGLLQKKNPLEQRLESHSCPTQGTWRRNVIGALWKKLLGSKYTRSISEEMSSLFILNKYAFTAKLMTCRIYVVQITSIRPWSAGTINIITVSCADLLMVLMDWCLWGHSCQFLLKCLTG